MAASGEMRFTRLKDVYASYHDYVCYLGLERDTGVQVFWYEFVNEGMSLESQQQIFRSLIEAKQITSPSILKILDVFLEEVPPRFIVITEATQAPSISDYLHTVQSPPALRALLKWFRLLCQAVQALHHANVVHGAITPYCTFLKTSAGTVKLRLPLTRLSCRLIPPSDIDLDGYKAPETLHGVITKATDIWALGVILLELVTGTQAYSELKTPFELIRALKESRQPASLATVEPPELCALIRSCLGPPDARPTVDDLLRDELLNPPNADGQHHIRPGSSTDKPILVLGGRDAPGPPA
jgi:serine/threonine protein kinase